MNVSATRTRTLGLALILHLLLLLGCAAEPPATGEGNAQPTATQAVAPVAQASLAPTAEDEPSSAGSAGDEAELEAVGGLRITVVYDNVPYDPRLQTAWGFAALIEHGDHTVLFDTGGDGPTLLANMAQLGIDLTSIEAVVLSHSHGDHTAGLPNLLDTGITPIVYLPASFPSSFKNAVRGKTELVEAEDAMEILPGIYVTGQVRSGVVEQGLVVETDEGTVLITGCAHPGIARMVQRAQETVPGRLALVMGGFHLVEADSAAIASIIADLGQMGVERVSPTHCTGDPAIRIFAEEYGSDCIQGGVGQVVVIGPEP